MTIDDTPSLSQIEVRIEHVPLAFFYELFTPTLTINGQRERRPWGVHSFSLPPGNYEVAVSYPWLFSSECGRNSVLFVLAPGETKTIRYRAGLIRYLPGSISVETKELFHNVKTGDSFTECDSEPAALELSVPVPKRLIFLYLFLVVEIFQLGRNVARGRNMLGFLPRFEAAIPPLQIVVLTVILVALFLRLRWVITVFRIYVGVTLVNSLALLGIIWSKTNGESLAILTGQLIGAALFAAAFIWFSWFVGGGNVGKYLNRSLGSAGRFANSGASAPTRRG